MSVCLLAIETSTDACSVAVTRDEHIYESFCIIPKQHTRRLLSMLDELLAQLEISFSQIDAIAFGNGPGSFTGLRIAASVVQGLAITWDRPVIPISTLQALAQGAHRQLGFREVFGCLDARMGEVYGGFYRFEENTRLMMPYVDNDNLPTTDFLINPAQIIFPPDIKWHGVGNGCAAFLSLFQQNKEFYTQSISSCDKAQAQLRSGVYKEVHEHRDKLATQSQLEMQRVYWSEKANDIYPSAHDVVALARPHFSQKEWVSAEEAVPIYLRDSIINVR